MGLSTGEREGREEAEEGIHGLTSRFSKSVGLTQPALTFSHCQRAVITGQSAHRESGRRSANLCELLQTIIESVGTYYPNNGALPGGDILRAHLPIFAMKNEKSLLQTDLDGHQPSVSQ
jgi:hypothetical protein